MNTKPEQHPAYFFLFLVFIYFICFYQLDSFCLQDWDESRVAKSSYELSKTGEMIVVKHEGKPDLWSTKPPMLNWIQAGSIKIFGLNELAVRLPSAVAGAVLLLMLFYFIKKYFRDVFLAYLVPVIFGTSGAFYQFDHSFRTADYDGALTVFLFSGCIFLFNYLHFNPEKKILIYLSAMFFLFAALTKGIAGFFLFPGIVIYILVTKKAVFLLKNIHFYLAFFTFLLLVAGFYFIRESRLPGYLEAVNNMELFGRYNNTFVKHAGEVDIWLNFRHLIDNRFSLYYLLIPFSIVIMPFIKDVSLRHLVIFSNTLIFSLLGILLLSKSKNTWYELPIIPFLSINAGVALVVLRDTIADSLNWKLYLDRDVSKAAILTFIFCFGFIPTLIRIYAPPLTTDPGYGYLTVVQNYIKQHRVIKNSIYLANLTQSQSFYFDMANEQGRNLKMDNISNVKPGNIYISAHAHIQQQLEASHKFTLLDQYNEIKVYRINQ